MIRLLSFFTSMTLFGTCLAQNHVTSVASAQDYKKFWDEGKLTWDDFREYHSTLQTSELKYFLGYKTEKQRYGDTTVMRVAAYAFMDKSLSWVNPESKTETTLRFNQVIFDIVELYRRRLQNEIDLTKYPFEFDNRFNSLLASCSREIDQFSLAAEGGRNEKALFFWENKTASELDAVPPNRIPSFSVSKFGYAMHAGLGSGIFTGTLGDYFKPTYNLIYGFDVAYKRTILYLNATLAAAKVRKSYTGKTEWLENENTLGAILDISLGYALIDNHVLKLSPFFGLGLTEFSKNNDENEEKVSITSTSAIFGLNADYKFRTRIALVSGSFTGIKEKTEISVRARLYLTKAGFYDDLSGYSVNLSLGICGFGNFIKVH